VVCGKKRGFWEEEGENEIERKRRRREYRESELT